MSSSCLHGIEIIVVCGESTVACSLHQKINLISWMDGLSSISRGFLAPPDNMAEIMLSIW